MTFQMITMKVPDEMLKTRRTSWGWERLTKKGDALIIPRKDVGNAKSSAHTYAAGYDFRIRTMAQEDGEGNVMMEDVYYDAKTDKEVDYADIPAEIKDDDKKFAKAYTMRSEPVALVVVRVTDPTEKELEKRARVQKGHPRAKAPAGVSAKAPAKKAPAKTH